jgi:rhamnogalacturonan endolyase
MKNYHLFGAAACLGTLPLMVSCTHAQSASPVAAMAPRAIAPRQVESLGRGVVALRQEDGKVFVSWRMLGTDRDDVAFNLYRTDANGKVSRLNAEPLMGATNFLDATANKAEACSYFVRTVTGGTEDRGTGNGGSENAPSGAFMLASNSVNPYLSVPLQTPQGYTPNDASVGDLDGDGEYDIVLHQTGRAKDNSQSGETDPPILQGYKLNGELLWTINLGKNIREGAHYTQFMVFDLDGNGRAEIVCKTADGTVDGQGKILGDAKANYVNDTGRILSGPEYLTVFDGLTGAALDTQKYVPGRHPDTDNPTGDQMKAVWGDGYGNRGDRFLACVAYLDGVHPSVVMCRGYYTRSVLAAWDFRGGKLTQRWVFDSNTPGNERYAGQGNHNLSVADVDADGRDEIIYGHMAVDDDGKGLYSTGIGHGDAMHVSDLDPARPGLEVFSIQESYRDAGLHMFDARTGEILWKIPPGAAGADREGPARGLSLDIDPRYAGFESWGAGAGMFGKIYDARGALIADVGKDAPAVNMGVFWDGDLLSEILSGTAVSKWDYTGSKVVPLLDAKAFGCASNNGTKANPSLSVDILGDWREEVIWRTEDNKELRIFSSTIPTTHRLRTLMHDSQYRLSIAWQNVAYNQPPHTSFYIGPDMKAPSRPNIVLVAPAKQQLAQRRGQN